MAKKKENSGSIFDDIIESQFSEMVDLSKEDDSVDYWVDTGNWALNYTISKKFRGGYPGGRISNLWGRSGTGKSLLPAQASKAKNWADIDFDLFDRIVVIDSEGGGTGKSLFSFVGAPVEKVRYINISTLDSWKINKSTGAKEAVSDKDVPEGKLETPTYIYHRGLISFMKKLVYALKYNGSKERILIIIDSISNIKSFRVAVENGEDMGRSNKLLNAFFALDNDFHEIGATVMLASKVYTNLNNPYDPWVMAGGESVLYNPSVNIKLSAMADSEELSADQVKEEKERRKTALGNSMKVIRATITKSRFGTENRNIWFMLDATYGMIRNSGLFKMLLDFGAIQKNGSRYILPKVFVDEKGEPKSFYKKDFLKIFSEHESEYIDKLQMVMDEIEDKIKYERMHVNVSDMEEYEESQNKEESESMEYSAADMLNAMEAEEEYNAEHFND